MSLMGQALYSMFLMKRQEVGAKVAEPIALCSKTDDVLESLVGQTDSRLRVVALDAAPILEPSET